MRFITMTGFTNLRPLLLIALATTTLAACVQVLGNEFVIVEEDDEGSGGSGAGMGGMTTAAGGAGGEGLGTSSAGGGMSYAGCDPMDLNVCPDGRKCGVVDLATGDTDCVDAGPTPPFAACESDAECTAGTFCSPLRRTCKPYCQTNADCGGAAGLCAAAWVALNTPVPGIGECIADCNPLAPQAQSVCGMGTTCSYASLFAGPMGPAAAFDCVRGGNIGLNGMCSGSTPDDFTRDCSYGLDCFLLMGIDVCRPWCEPIGQQAGCPAGFSCVDAGATQQGYNYGACL